MPTATVTTTSESSPTIIPLKASSPLPSTDTTALRSFYKRAARAFLHRDIIQTHSLLTSAFEIITPPQSPYTSDTFALHRRKWDILRITLETTLHHSPPRPTDVESTIPPALRDNLLLPSQTLVNVLHQRSLALFTPTSHAQKPSSAFLPSQVLITLVLSSMKLDCPDMGRGMIEDWLAKRGQFSDELHNDGEGCYEKVLDIYCLHVLPRLEEWEYAKEFLQYESELPQDKRKRFAVSLQKLYNETMAARRPPTPPTSSTQNHSSSSSPSSPSRSASPAPSTSSSSSSSSLSTTSTHTVVPRTPRPPHALTTHLLINSPSTTSIASDSTITPITTRRSSHPHLHTHSRSHSRSRHPNDTKPTTRTNGSPFRPHPATSTTTTAATPRAPSMLTLVKASLEPYLTTSRVTTLLFVFIFLPLVSLLLRVRRQRRRGRGLGGGSGLGIAGAGMGLGSVAAAEVVRRKLGTGGTGRSTLGWVWGEVVRAVGDTIRMGGGGLG